MSSPQETKTMSQKYLAIPFSESEHLPAIHPNQHHQISDDTRNSHDISRMLGDYYDDPATKVVQNACPHCYHVLLTPLT